MKSKREKIFLFLATFFIANAIIAEIIGGKLIVLGDLDFSFILDLGFFEKRGDSTGVLSSLFCNAVTGDMK